MFTSHLDYYYDIEGQFFEYIKKLGRKYFSLEETEKENISSIREFINRKERIQQDFINGLGGLDFERCSLNPLSSKKIVYDKYSLQNIIYESLPNFHVTSNLYMPLDESKKYPAILFTCGHSDDGKLSSVYQNVCIDLVENGFIVLAVDPIGQGERLQYYDKTKGTSTIGIGCPEHSYAGLQCSLTGSNIARYFIWDLIRGLDYLETLPQVDSNRFGVCGNSGGGLQTSYMMFLEPRIKAAAPSCYINSRENYLKTGQAHCGEQNIYGTISNGINCDDFATSFAPKPLLLNGARYDFFCIEGLLKSFEIAKKTYSLFGAEDMVELCLSDTVHGYNDITRQATINFFLKRLYGLPGKFITSSTTRYEKPELLTCTSSGQVTEEFEQERTVYDLNLEYYNSHKYKTSNSREELKDRVWKVMNIHQGKLGGDYIHDRRISCQQKNNINYEKIFFFSEEDLIVSAIYITKNIEDICGTILLLDEGTSDIDKEYPFIESLLKKGGVLVFDPRGIGGVKSRYINSTPDYDGVYGTEHKLNCDAIMMGTSNMAMRTHDLSRAVQYVKQRFGGNIPSIAAKGKMSALALIYAALDKEIDKIILRNPLNSFQDIIIQKYFECSWRLEVFGVLKEFDLPLICNVLKEYGCNIEYFYD